MDDNDHGMRLLCSGTRLRRANDGADRLYRLLAKFLQRKYSQQQETTEAQNLEIEVKNYKVTLPYDLLFKIFIFIPAEFLSRLQFVCKTWFSLINSSSFITRQCQQSKTVLISKKLIILKPDFYATLLPHMPLEEHPKSYFHFLDLDNGNDDFIESSLLEFVHIRASCDGLVLANMEKKKSLILINPVTRKHITLPLGTVGYFIEESYGIAAHAKTYKVVHLFRQTTGGDTFCEILSISTRTWKTVVERPYGLFRDLRRIPVSVGGSLYWIPCKDGCDYFVSMSMKDEKFILKKLPSHCYVKDRILEIGGNIGFVNHAEDNVVQVWILVNDDWIKSYRINLDVDFGYQPIPICSSRNGKEMVFECPGHKLYVYNFEKGEMKLVHSGDDDANEVLYERIENLYIPHRNTLASWENL